MQKDYEGVQMKSSREQFEHWFSTRKIAMQKKGVAESSIVRLHRKMLEAWQASRASIVIELPWLGKSSLMDTDDVVEAIESQGLTAKAKP